MIVDLLANCRELRVLNPKNPWESIAQAAEKMIDTDLEVDLNFFPTPRGDRGRIANIRGDNLTMGHLFRAAFQNMAESFYDCALRLWPESPGRTSFSPEASPASWKCCAKAFRRDLTHYRLAPFEEDTLFGLLILASVFSGRAQSVAEATI